MKFNNHRPFSPADTPFFYGWIIVVGAVFGNVMSAPGQTIGVSVFNDYLLDALRLTRLQLSIAYALGTIVSAFLVARVGFFLDQSGARVLAVISSLGLGASLIYLSQVDRVSRAAAQFVPAAAAAFGAVTAGFLLVRFFGQGALTLASRTMVMKWFDRLRGRVNSIAGLFISLMFSGSPWVFEQLIVRFTWRGAWIMLGIIIGVGFTAFTFCFFRDTPEESGLKPDGPFHRRTSVTTAAEQSFDIRGARRTPAFWVFNLGTGLFSLLLTAVSFHIVSVFQTAGRTRLEAIAVFPKTSLIAVVVSLIVGFLSDSSFLKYRLKYVQLLLLLALTLVCVGVAGLEKSWGTFLLISGMGVANGLFGTLITVVWPRYFGTRCLGAIAGFNMTCLVFASAIGPPLWGASLTYAGTYRTAAIICGAVALLLAIVSLRANRPPQEPR